MTALIGTFVRMQTLADMTPRIVLDMQCTLAELAALGIEAGTPFALARLNPNAANAALAPQPEPEPAPEPVKGGPLAKLAGMWCNDQDFQAWLEDRFVVMVNSPNDAAVVIRHKCGVASRAELDNDAAAADKFNTQFRMPYMAYQQGRTK